MRRTEVARLSIIDHLSRHEGYVAWSGGKDSTAVVHLARHVRPHVPVCFFDSGLEYPETLSHIEQLAAAWRLNLHVVACEPTALEWMVRSGHWSHEGSTRLAPDWGSLHETLIARPATECHRRFGAGVLIGLRSEESEARRKLLGRGRGHYRTSAGGEALAPIALWDTGQVWAYHARHDIPLNPVYGKLAELGVEERFQRVGLVLDGNCLQYGRAVWLRRGWPDLWQRLADQLPRLREMS